ncbi:hypothetical protein HPC49_03885 [Pyxidicoccus fallax]|uniref:Uncharacterized protein n=1 Tax=Pyxidicoccus fallax TaxID=394095 RepID=A0A848L7U1_9BACT|nr:hypothetical protein [Pyxidicoccus fallax]NMO14627.1 hypothetical protein [Pyxidicoccus fallax]NPC77391.1 hypothetical protein [Pyxidicoccus fallax]
MDVSAPLPDFSLLKGGPLFRVERALRLVPSERPGGFRCTLALVMLAWLPIPLLTLLRGGTALDALFSELQVHAQLLLALAVLIAAEPYVDGRLSLAARQFLASHLVGVGSRPAFVQAARDAMRWRDRALAEVCLLVAAFALGLLSRHDPARTWIFDGVGESPSLAGWWYLAVSQPLFRFLALRWLWRGVLWARFLFRVSRLPLTLVPTHPDMTGGLGFLAICQASFAPVVFALAAAVASEVWGDQPDGVVGMPLPYLVPLAVLGGISAIVVYAPLGFFTPQLVRAKRRGDLRFSELAAWHSRRFERKWFADREGGELLGAPEFSSLADLGSAFVTARKMRLFPFDPRSLVAVVGAALAPLAILLMLDREFLKVLKQIHEGLP